MAHMITCDGIHQLTGAISKKKDTMRLSITRVKHFRDPMTGEETAVGPNEMFLQYRRDYKRHPLTPAEQAQRERWREACRQASAIVRDKNHPQYMELYRRWRAQLNTAAPCKQFPNFVRAELAREDKARGL